MIPAFRVGVIMPVHSVTSKPNWLLALLAEKRARIAGWVGQLAGLGQPGTMKPGAFRKYLCLLAEIAAAEKEENDYYEQIEALEDAHRARREAKNLEKANPAYNANDDAKPENRTLWQRLRAHLVPLKQDIQH